jgi:putative tricarboxylic transport membrane protein
VLVVLSQKMRKAAVNAVDSVLPRVRDVLKYWRTILRSGVIGVLHRHPAGVGEDMAAWSSYAAARRASKEKTNSARARSKG